MIYADDYTSTFIIELLLLLLLPPCDGVECLCYACLCRSLRVSLAFLLTFDVSMFLGGLTGIQDYNKISQKCEE